MGKFNRQFGEFNAPRWGNKNPYYNPAECGLEIVGTADADLSWEFDMIVVWKDVATGAFFAAHDSGCSCPTPFEDVTGLDKMTRIKKVEDFDRFAEPHLKGSYTQIPVAEIRKIRTSLSRRLKNAERKAVAAAS